MSTPEEPYDEQPGIDFVELFLRSHRARTIMACARRAGITWQEACLKWSDPMDLQAEMAYDTAEAMLKAQRCPNCGVAPGEVYDEETEELLAEPAFRLTYHTCMTCADIALAEKRISDDDRRHGDRVMVEPREPGETYFPLRR